MPLKFKRIYKALLRNLVLMQMMLEFKSAFSTRQAYLPTVIRNIFTQKFLPALAALDEGLKKIRGSAFTKKLLAADKARDEVFAGLVNIHSAALTHFDAAKREAAEELVPVFRTYGNIAKLPFNEETAAVVNFLQDIRSAAHVEHAETLGLTEWAAFLETRNMAFNNLMRQRADEAAGRSAVVVKEARAAVCDAYDELVEKIEAFVCLGIGEPENLEMAASLITTFNQLLEKYELLIRKRKQGGAEEDGAEEGEEQEEEGQGEE